MSIFKIKRLNDKVVNSHTKKTKNLDTVNVKFEKLSCHLNVSKTSKHELQLKSCFSIFPIKLYFQPLFTILLHYLTIEQLVKKNQNWKYYIGAQLDVDPLIFLVYYFCPLYIQCIEIIKTSRKSMFFLYGKFLILELSCRNFML